MLTSGPFGEYPFLEHCYRRGCRVPDRTDVRPIVQPELQLHEIVFGHLIFPKAAE